MELDRLRTVLIGLDEEDALDLKAFLAYRGQANRLPCKLFNELMVKDASPTKDRLLKQLDTTDGAFRTAKAELVKLVLEWRSLNSKGWTSPLLRKLMKSHTLLEWGESKKAYNYALEVQLQAEEHNYYAVARLALELRSALAQRVYPDHSSEQLKHYVDEMARIDGLSKTFKEVTDLYIMVARLADGSMLLRNPTDYNLFNELNAKAQKMQKRMSDLPFNLWAYHMQTLAILAQMQGNMELTHQYFSQLWQQMNVTPRPIPMGDHRFYQFFLSYIETAIRCRDTYHAHDANLLYASAISMYYGNSQKLRALNHLFGNLIELQEMEEDQPDLSHLKESICNIHHGRLTDDGDFDLMGWDLYISTSILTLLISTCFENHLWKECGHLLGLAKRLNAKNTASATDLQTIAPLIGLAVQFEQNATTRNPISANRIFEADANYCYDHFRKQRDHYPIEWELARLFHRLSSGRKPQQKLFNEINGVLENLQQDAPYYHAFMQFFDFGKWIGRHAEPVLAGGAMKG